MAKKKHVPESLPTGPLKNLLAWWRKAKVQGVIIGGLAVSLLGRPRTTRDVDATVIIEEDQWQSFLDSGAVDGFLPRIPDALAFAQRHRVLLLHHQPSGTDVDISLGNLEFEKEAVARSRKKKLGGLWLPLPTPEDLIVMKAVAHRDLDLHDIRGLLDCHPDLDEARIRHWVDWMAKELEMPEIYQDIDRMLRTRRKD